MTTLKLSDRISPAKGKRTFSPQKTGEKKRYLTDSKVTVPDKNWDYFRDSFGRANVRTTSRGTIMSDDSADLDIIELFKKSTPSFYMKTETRWNGAPAIGNFL